LTKLGYRFVFPQDKDLIVYFEWEALPGSHTLTGVWKGPDGRTASISSDIKIDTTTSELNAYWIYNLAATMATGIWTLEVRLDGQPAGSHSFELVIPEQPKENSRPLSPASPEPPTLDELYKSAVRSVVWVHKLDEAGRRIDTGSGFVIAANCVATAFQAIDSATHLEVEFAGGRRVATDEIWAWQRLEDWTLIKVDTGDTPPLIRGDVKTVAVGQRLIVFNVEAGFPRAIGGYRCIRTPKPPKFRRPNPGFSFSILLHRLRQSAGHSWILTDTWSA
jgi:hypothetical protein